MALHSPKRRNDDLPLPLSESTNEGIDGSCFEKGLIAKGNENPITSGIDSFEAPSDGGAHAFSVIAIHLHLYPLARQNGAFLQSISHLFTWIAENNDNFSDVRSKEGVKAVFKHSLPPPGKQEFVHAHPFRLTRTEKNGRDHYLLPFPLKL